MLLKQLGFVRQDTGEEGAAAERRREGFPTGAWPMAGLFSHGVNLLKSQREVASMDSREE